MQSIISFQQVVFAKLSLWYSFTT